MTKTKKKAGLVMPELPIDLLIRTFDFLALHSDHLSTAKFLQFWYNHFLKFNDFESDAFMAHLIRNHFNILFFHWASPVRTSFYYLILYRMLFREKTGKKKSIWKKSLQEINSCLNYMLQFYYEYRRYYDQWKVGDKVTRRLITPDKIRVAVATNHVVPPNFKKINFFEKKQLPEKPKDGELKAPRLDSGLISPGMPLGKRKSNDFDQITASNSGILEFKRSDSSKYDTYLDQNLDIRASPQAVAQVLKHFEIAMRDYREALFDVADCLSNPGCNEERDFPVLKLKIPIDKTE